MNNTVKTILKIVAIVMAIAAVAAAVVGVVTYLKGRKASFKAELSIVPDEYEDYADEDIA